MEQLQEIPRFYTALAEWGACIGFLIIAKKNWSLKEIIFSAAMLIWQAFFLIITGPIHGLGFAFCMCLAIFFLFLFLFFVLNRNKRLSLYFLALAFILAEFTASLEWQVETYLKLSRIPGYDLWKYAILVIVYLGIFQVAFRYEKKMLTREYLRNITLKEGGGASAIALLIFIFSNLSYLFDTPFSTKVPFDVFIIRTLVDAVGVCIILSYQGKFHDIMIQKELEQVQLVLERQYTEYRSLQENIEQLHILKHDLKHQIHALSREADEKKREEWIRSIEEELDQDVLIGKTGNVVLDNLLEMKLQTAKKWNVHFTCIAEGDLLNFMHVKDICALFGNAMDNALESVYQLEDPQKRLIQMNVVRQKNMVCILVRNYTENVLHSKKGSAFPKTTKADKQNHGFGLKSISYCVEKYNGTMSVSLEQNWFKLAILLPIPEEI